MRPSAQPQINTAHTKDIMTVIPAPKERKSPHPTGQTEKKRSDAAKRRMKQWDEETQENPRSTTKNSAVT
jgi:hypothetical protein